MLDFRVCDWLKLKPDPDQSPYGGFLPLHVLHSYPDTEPFYAVIASRFGPRAPVSFSFFGFQLVVASEKHFNLLLTRFYFADAIALSWKSGSRAKSRRPTPKWVVPPVHGTTTCVPTTAVCFSSTFGFTTAGLISARRLWTWLTTRV